MNLLFRWWVMDTATATWLRWFRSVKLTGTSSSARWGFYRHVIGSPDGSKPPRGALLGAPQFSGLGVQHGPRAANASVR